MFDIDSINTADRSSEAFSTRTAVFELRDLPYFSEGAKNRIQSIVSYSTSCKTEFGISS